MRNLAQSIVKSRVFEIGVLVVIVFASVLVGAETYPRVVARWGTTITFLNDIILWIFVVEIFLKMAQHGRHFMRYFRDPWNVFDFSIVALCFLPIHAHYAAVLRMVRVLRALRLTTALPQLQLIVGALIKSIPSMAYVGLLLALCFYVYAVIGVFLFRENDPFHFGDLPSAMLSLFRVVTLEDWTDVMYTQMYGSGVYPYPDVSDAQSEHSPQPLVAVFYFVTFVLFATMIMLNLFIGVIINSMEEAQTDQSRDKLAAQRQDGSALTIVQEIEQIDQQLEKMRESMKQLRLMAEGNPPTKTAP